MHRRYGVVVLLAMAPLVGCAHGTPGCQSASVVTSGFDIAIPKTATPVPYMLGGQPTPSPRPSGAPPLPKGAVAGPPPGWLSPASIELSDGHVYMPENVIDAALSGQYEPNPAHVSAGQSVDLRGDQQALGSNLLPA